MQKAKREIHWINTLFLVISPIVAILGTWAAAHYEGISWQTWTLFGVFTLISGVGITGGYHRLMAHKTYDASNLFKIFLLIAGATSLQNSALKWSADHRRHHQHVDKEADPYSIQEGFWHAHIGWIFFKDPHDNDFSAVKDLLQDKWIMWQHRYYLPIVVVFSFLLPMAIASLWGNPLGGLFVAGFLRVVLNHHFTFSINSFCHFIGTQPYSEKNSSRDSWICALFTYGEGYHNFHHTFPNDYRNGIKFWQWDPSKWLIGLMSWFGQAYNMRITPDAMIIQAKLRMQEIKLREKLEKRKMLEQRTLEVIAQYRQRVEEAYIRMHKLQQEYIQMRNQKMDQLEDNIRRMKWEMKKARLNCKEAFDHWQMAYEQALQGRLVPIS